MKYFRYHFLALRTKDDDLDDITILFAFVTFMTTMGTPFVALGDFVRS